jgi:putative intracellular protease/amidase
MLKGSDGKEVMHYEIYTVAAGTDPIHTTGSNRAGMKITPDYGFADAPTPDIVVVGAQSGGTDLAAWLRKIHAERKTIMSVCTGAFQLARAGLLDGKQATTHHWYFGNLEHDFPDVKLVREVRYVQADPVTYTAGGLTSGVDLSLHLVAQRFGQDVAQRTADYMEYLGTGWNSNHGISELTTPVTHKHWKGAFAPGYDIVVDMTIHGASPSFTTNIPAQHITDAPTTAKQDGKQVTLFIDIADHPATFTGIVNPAGTEIAGTFTQDDTSHPLTLTESR